MNNKPALIVLAAGLGSRYGSLKQMDSFGPSDEAIIDYTIYDSIEAGFKKFVFVIRRSMEEEFETMFLSKIQKHAQVEFVFQELDILPEGYQMPNGREKPWGTAHAVMIAMEKIDGPFALVNADDFYGRSSLKAMYAQLNELNDSELQACLVGYKLKNTLSAHGRVSRGICQVGTNNMLEGITERTHIFGNGDGTVYYTNEDEKFDLTGEETVSMNLIGFTSKVGSLLNTMFVEFLKREGNELKSEFFIPSVLDRVRSFGIEIPVLQTNENWFGVTYPEDKTIAKERLNELVDDGVYPKNLWI